MHPKVPPEGIVEALRFHGAGGFGRDIHVPSCSPSALARGVLAPAPEPLVGGHDLRDIPAAMEVLRKGVSPRKVVTTLA
jgi:hypothetical protein